MAIHLGRPLPDASRDLPGRRRGNPLGQPCLATRPTYRPYLVLLPVGFTLPPPLPGARCALTAPFHPYPPSPRRAPVRAVCFLWHFPWGRPRRALPGTVFPWSPDFPPPIPAGAGSEGSHPAVWQSISKNSKGLGQASGAVPRGGQRFRRRLRRSASRAGSDAGRR